MKLPLPVLIDENPVERLPVLFLAPHASCNCRCVMCDIWQNRSKKEITAADVERWVDDWKGLGIRHVIMTGGEALMHSHLWDLCGVLKENAISVTLLSTGISLKHHAKNVVRYTNGVRVSLDGPRVIHDEIRRVPRAFDRLAEGVAALKEIAPSFGVFARSAIHRRNCRHLRDIVDSAHAIGLDRVSFLATDITSDAFNRKGGVSLERIDDIGLRPADLPALEAEIDALEQSHARDFAAGYIHESPTELRQRILQYYRAHLGQADFHPNTCNSPWISAYVEYDGTTRPCFFQKPYGNLYEAGSLSSLVNSNEAVEFRRGLDVTRDPVCQRCVCTMAVYRCDCKWTRTPPYCDKTCLLAEFL
jgi:MoaA/NifB/PqqE/SkfB family radical SAM enzyme